MPLFPSQKYLLLSGLSPSYFSYFDGMFFTLVLSCVLINHFFPDTLVPLLRVSPKIQILPISMLTDWL